MQLRGAAANRPHPMEILPWVGAVRSPEARQCDLVLWGEGLRLSENSGSSKPALSFFTSVYCLKAESTMTLDPAVSGSTRE